MATLPYLDSNILLRYLRNDIPDQAERSRLLLERVERGELKVVLLPQVLFEVVFTLTRTYKVPRAAVREALSAIIAVPGIQLPNKSLYVRALTMFETYNVPFVDAYIATVMHARGDTDIYSWDHDFDSLPHVRRLEP